MEKAMLGAGCFWTPEYYFAQVPGVLQTQVGYCGGTFPNPTDRDVYTKKTGHVEVVLLTFDPARISYPELVEKFFAMHDPTQIDRQGVNIGPYYRSAIFFFSPKQEKIAREAKERLTPRYKKPIATTIEPAQTFWPADEFHQKFYEKRGGGSCHIF